MGIEVGRVDYTITSKIKIKTCNDLRVARAEISFHRRRNQGGGGGGGGWPPHLLGVGPNIKTCTRIDQAASVYAGSKLRAYSQGSQKLVQCTIKKSTH